MNANPANDPGTTAEGVAGITDAAQRALAAHRLIEARQGEINELSSIRRQALIELLGTGLTQAQVADLLGMSRARVSQLLAGPGRPERAFLGTGQITVAIGVSDLKQGVSAESAAAFDLLAKLARAVGLDAQREVVPPPGHVHLNRPNLVVLTSPRLLPFVSQVMEADPRLRFQVDTNGWYLVDMESGTEYRSPLDAGENADFAYVGRLPRPDGKGTFLYLAGTHAPGTLGAAYYVVDNIATLYRELKNRRFSVAVRCTFKPGQPCEISSVEAVTPVFRHEP